MTDPLDAYLARKTAAQPEDADPLDAYLAKKTGAAATGLTPERMAKLQAGIAKQQAKVAALNAEPDPMSAGQVLGEIGSQMKDRVAGLGRGAVAIGTGLAHPIDTVTSPERRREFERGVDDIVTLGYGQKLAARVGNALGDVERGKSLDETKHFAARPLAGDTNAPSRVQAADAEAAPGFREAGNITGMILPGAGNSIGRGATNIAGKLIGTGAKAAPGVIGSAGRAALAYELAAPTFAATQASSAGDRLGATGRAALDPIGGLMAAGTGAAGGVLSDKIKNSRGAKAREFIEREGQGAEVGVTSAGKGGVFDRDLAGVSPTDRGTGVASKRAATAIDKSLKSNFREEYGKPYKVVGEQIDNSAGQGMRDATPLIVHMEDAVNDLETPDAARARLEAKLKILKQPKFLADPNDPESGVQLSERQLNGLRRDLMRMAKVGKSDTVKEADMPLRKAAFLAKEMVDEGPYASVNKVYSEGSSKLARSREQLGLDAIPAKRARTDIKKIKLTLQREGANTETAGGDSDVATFRQEHPELRLQTNMPELARSRADLSYRLLPQHGGLIPRLAGASMGPAAAAVAMAAGHGAPGLLAGATILGLQNATPIAGRILYPMARGGVNPMVWASQEKQRRDAELAAKLRGAP